VSPMINNDRRQPDIYIAQRFISFSLPIVTVPSH
jgi:hypothetical protein